MRLLASNSSPFGCIRLSIADGQVAMLACGCESVTIMNKLEQLYAYFSTTGEDTRIFGFGEGAPVMRGKIDCIGGLPEGSRLVHPTRGAGVVVRIDLTDRRGKPVIVEFESGEVHHYSIDSALKLKAMASVGELPEMSRLSSCIVAPHAEVSSDTVAEKTGALRTPCEGLGSDDEETSRC